MTDRDERALIAVAGRMALVLTGQEHGTTWYVDDSLGDGLWIVLGVDPIATSRWSQWT